MAIQSYKTVYTGGEGEIEEKKSRFIAHVFPVESEEQASEFVEKTKKKYWDARHNCYAYVLGSSGEVSRCSDDGEPSGTAGRPILEVLMGQEIRNVLVIVTRYFGGTLLGTGGLVRAYSQATQAGLKESQLITKTLGYRMTIDTDYNGIGKLQFLAAGLEIPIVDTLYSDRVQMILMVASEQCDRVKKEVTEATAGQAKIHIEEKESFFATIEKETIIFEQ